MRKESREKSTFTPNVISVQPDISTNGAAVRSIKMSG
jgi:hypothetical protein